MGKRIFQKKIPSDGRTLTTLKTDASPIEIGWGYYRYFTNCIGCHSLPVTRGGAIPNLAYSPDDIFDNYQSILRDGLLVDIGMPVHNWLSEKDVENIKAYILFTSQLIQENKSPSEVTSTLARYQKIAFESGLPDHSDVPASPSISQSKTMPQGNAVDGKRRATVCKSCHTFEKGDSNGVGPNL